MPLFDSYSREQLRQTYADAWRKAAGPTLKLIVHVGHNSLTECRDLACHADSIGAAMRKGF